jgi:decaprenylphospho-beta-D-ribofuranose 2-oxidase
MSVPGCVVRPLSGWGRYPVESSCVYEPRAEDELAEILAGRRQETYISRGAGRSYGDAALNARGAVVSHLRLNRLLDFDPATGVLACEAGVTIGDIVAALLPRGFFPAVVPGTRAVTVGGAIANDIHGKNHPRAGSFASTLTELTLLTPEGRRVVCSPAVHAAAFWATAGGLGLTGVILSARLRLRRVEGDAMAVDVRRLPDLDATLRALDDAARTREYALGWVDGLARGRASGRGVVFAGDHAAAGDGRGARRRTLRVRLQVPFTMPAGLLRPTAVRVFNGWYHGRHAARAAGGSDVDRFFFPLDRVVGWNRLYGRPGFVQYQAAVPAGAAPAAFADMLERGAAHGHAPYLVVVKRFGPANPGPLSFPLDGFTIAMDMPVRPGLRAHARALDEIVLRGGGRVYPGKDVFLDGSTLRAMYPQVSRFLGVRRELDPERVLGSTLARRAELY